MIGYSFLGTVFRNKANLHYEHKLDEHRLQNQGCSRDSHRIQRAIRGSEMKVVNRLQKSRQFSGASIETRAPFVGLS